MRKNMTIVCSICFMISGIMLAITATDPSPGNNQKALNAATMQPLVLPPYTAEYGNAAKPQFPLMELAVVESPNITEQTTVIVDSFKIDSLERRIAELEKGQVTKVKWRKVSAPKPVVVRDTIRETHYYLATQSGTKEGPEGECIPVYEVHKVDELCPEIINSSVESSNESNSDVGE